MGNKGLTKEDLKRLGRTFWGKENRRRVDNALSNVLKKRKKWDWAEKAARTVGKVGGYLVGGAPGAAVGDFVAGGTFDLIDQTQETAMDDPMIVKQGYSDWKDQDQRVG